MENYDWKLFGDMETYLQRIVGEFVEKQEFIGALVKKLTTSTSTKLIDWIDHLVLPADSDVQDEILNVGFKRNEYLDAPKDVEVYTNEENTLFSIIIADQSNKELALKPENIQHFVQILGQKHDINGREYSSYRTCVVTEDTEFKVSAVERRGYAGFCVDSDPTDTEEYQEALEQFRHRRRHYVEPSEGIEALQNLVEELGEGLEPARVADAFFRAERIYWQSRDRAGKIQKTRQDELGLGWGNHDHHTYRSSRALFPRLISLLEKMGFSLREQFYAGERAGWGAQVLEQEECNIVVFADIDISVEEKEIDFAHAELAEKASLGTVGLWTGLHGESVLAAGLHHLAARVDFEEARTALDNRGVEVMRPFSDFPFLKQAFTGAQRRDVEDSRLKSLLKRKAIGERTHDNFAEEGAIGSHLEIIERGQGFKGFNQDSVTAIIRATDPRNYEERRA